MSMSALRLLARGAAVVGAVGSVGLTLYTGRHNPSGFLMALFAMWVLAPFLGFELADMASQRWTALTRAALYGVMLVLTVASLAIYGAVAFGPPRARTASFFLVIPPASCLLMATVAVIATLLSKRPPSGGPSPP